MLILRNAFMVIILFCVLTMTVLNMAIQFSLPSFFSCCVTGDFPQIWGIFPQIWGISPQIWGF